MVAVATVIPGRIVAGVCVHAVERVLCDEIISEGQAAATSQVDAIAPAASAPLIRIARARHITACAAIIHRHAVCGWCGRRVWVGAFGRTAERSVVVVAPAFAPVLHRIVQETAGVAELRATLQGSLVWMNRVLLSVDLAIGIVDEATHVRVAARTLGRGLGTATSVQVCAVFPSLAPGFATAAC